LQVRGYLEAVKKPASKYRVEQYQGLSVAQNRSLVVHQLQMRSRQNLAKQIGNSFTDFGLVISD